MFPNRGPGNHSDTGHNSNNNSINSNHSHSHTNTSHPSMESSASNLTPADARALALHLQHLQRLQLLQQQHQQQQNFLSEVLAFFPPSPLSSNVSSSLEGGYRQGAAFASTAPPLASQSHMTANRAVGGSHVSALVAAAAEKIASDAALAACLSSLGTSAASAAAQSRQQLQQQRYQQSQPQAQQQRQIELFQLCNMHQPQNRPQHQPAHLEQPQEPSNCVSTSKDGGGSSRGRSSSHSTPTPPTKRPPNAKATPDDAFPSERESVEVSADACPSPESALKVLRTLGTTLRSKADRFVDVSRYPMQDASTNEKRRGASIFFPEILYQMLLECERDGLAHVISFLPHGRAFRVHNKVLFEREVLPKYFLGQTKWSSFSRQLNLYGFLRITTGTDYGAYYHELFLRGRPDLNNFMRRVGKPHGLDRRKHKLAEGQDPNLYDLPPVLLVPFPPGSAAAAPTMGQSKAFHEP